MAATTRTKKHLRWQLKPAVSTRWFEHIRVVDQHDIERTHDELIKHYDPVALKNIAVTAKKYRERWQLEPDATVNLLIHMPDGVA